MHLAQLEKAHVRTKLQLMIRQLSDERVRSKVTRAFQEYILGNADVLCVASIYFAARSGSASQLSMHVGVDESRAHNHNLRSCV